MVGWAWPKSCGLPTPMLEDEGCQRALPVFLNGGYPQVVGERSGDPWPTKTKCLQGLCSWDDFLNNYLEGPDVLPGPQGLGIWAGRGWGAGQEKKSLSLWKLSATAKCGTTQAHTHPLQPPKAGLPFALQRKMGSGPEMGLSF